MFLLRLLCLLRLLFLPCPLYLPRPPLLLRPELHLQPCLSLFPLPLPQPLAPKCRGCRKSSSPPWTTPPTSRRPPPVRETESDSDTDYSSNDELPFVDSYEDDINQQIFAELASAQPQPATSSRPSTGVPSTIPQVYYRDPERALGEVYNKNVLQTYPDADTVSNYHSFFPEDLAAPENSPTTSETSLSLRAAMVSRPMPPPVPTFPNDCIGGEKIINAAKASAQVQGSVELPHEFHDFADIFELDYTKSPPRPAHDIQFRIKTEELPPPATPYPLGLKDKAEESKQVTSLPPCPQTDYPVLLSHCCCRLLCQQAVYGMQAIALHMQPASIRETLVS